MSANKLSPRTSAMIAGYKGFALNMTWVERGYNGVCASILEEDQARREARVGRTFQITGKTMTVLSRPNAIVETA